VTAVTRSARQVIFYLFEAFFVEDVSVSEQRTARGVSIGEEEQQRDGPVARPHKR